MKKFIIFIILILMFFVSSLVFSEENNLYFNTTEKHINPIEQIDPTDSFEWYLGISTSTVRKLNLSIGTEVGVNKYISKDLTVGAYLHSEFYPQPLGSNSNALARFETEFDFGLNLGKYIYENDSMRIKISADIGYYMQFIKFNESISSQIYLGYNGGIVRPIIFFEFYKAFSSPIGIALALNNTTIIPYSDYENISLMFVI